MKETIKSMQERGIQLMYGRWLIEGAPRVLLIDTGTGYRFLDEWKGDLWAAAGIPSPAGDHETNETIVFGYLVAWFLGEVRLGEYIQGSSFANKYSSSPENKTAL
jgi:glycogen synthase